MFYPSGGLFLLSCNTQFLSSILNYSSRFRIISKNPTVELTFKCNSTQVWLTISIAGERLATLSFYIYVCTYFFYIFPSLLLSTFARSLSCYFNACIITHHRLLSLSHC